ncbi:MAG: hypothetical protein OES47_10175 [Acidobacteriota bacterium]|nr:hypothetical protein [Acidobacteriota bacterium]
MRHPARMLRVLAGFLMFAWSGSFLFAETEVGESHTYEVWYALNAEFRGRGSDADIRAGGRLLMRLDPEAASGRRLELVRPLEDPWKLYSVDPLGPFGGETKLALVTTLPEASWEALDESQAEIARIGRERLARWIEATRSKRRLDGAFGFVAIGPATGRFAIDFHTGGRVLDVTNGLTDRWLPGPFDQFIGSWGSGFSDKDAPRGYWFWNQGETKPFEWEPHTYHAMAAALELLALPLPPNPDSGPRMPTVSWESPEVLAFDVLTTLAPKIAGRIRDRSSHQGAVEVKTRRDGDSLRIRVDRTAEGLQIDRELIFSDSPTPPLSDRLRLRIESRRRLLEIEVGYAANLSEPK